jgi:hypothetical protein
LKTLSGCLFKEDEPHDADIKASTATASITRWRYTMTAAHTTDFASHTHLNDAYVASFTHAFEELMHMRQLDHARRLVAGWVQRLEEGHEAAARLAPHVRQAKELLALYA